VGFPEVTIGGVPGWGGTIRLQELIGRSRATRMILTGNRVSAHEALQLGLIDEQAADGSALRAALDLAAELATRSPVALRLATHAARCGSPYDADAHADVEMAANLLCMHSPDRRGAVASFLDPR
jgi:enoyl-CoA hydratase